jgi:hypothetical protein
MCSEKKKRRPATGDAELGHEILDDTEEADAREEVLVHELLHASSPKRRPVGVHLGLGFWDQHCDISGVTSLTRDRYK